MARPSSKLRNALDRHKGKDFKLEKQKKLQKEAAKRKRKTGGGKVAVEDGDRTMEYEGPAEGAEDEEDGWDSDGDDEDANELLETLKSSGFDISQLSESDSDSEIEIEAPQPKRRAKEVKARPVSNGTKAKTSAVPDATADGEADAMEVDDDDGNDDDGGNDNGNADIPLSDIEVGSDEEQDLIPHQRLTINNTAALMRAHKSIALPLSRLPFSEHQSLTTAEPVSIPDIDDDLNRELALYAQCLTAARSARTLLLAEAAPFTRPTDYFAEMVKSDEHMGRVKGALVRAAADKQAAADARRQRDLKRFGKQVQTEKLKERAQAKRATLDAVSRLKRKRQGADDPAAAGGRDDDLFDVALEDADVTARRDREDRRARGPAAGGKGVKRRKKDERFGFGGKKRFAKSGDAVSSADMSGYSVKKMKDRGGGRAGGAAKRPGKTRRASMR